MKRRLLRLYVWLLDWLPRGFRELFGAEMAEVAASQLDDAARRGKAALLWLFAGELAALPGLYRQAWRRQVQAAGPQKGKETLMSATTEIRRGTRWSLGLGWALASAAGLGLVFALPYALIRPLQRLLGPFDEDRFFGWAFSVLFVLLPPLFQWLVLRRRLPGAGRWLLTGLGWLAAGLALRAVASLDPAAWGDAVFLPALLSALAFGTCLGLPQWALLRRHIRLPGLWVVAALLGWACAFMFYGQSLDRASELAAFAALPGLCPALALAFLWQAPGERLPARLV